MVRVFPLVAEMGVLQLELPGPGPLVLEGALASQDWEEHAAQLHESGAAPGEEPQADR